MSLAFSTTFNTGALSQRRQAVPVSSAQFGLRIPNVHQASSSTLCPAQATSPLLRNALLSVTQSKRNVSAMAGYGRTKKYSVALLFDCDGVIVETEELHRKAYNAAFESFGCKINGKPLVWTVEYYDKLQNTVGGGKPKMKYHFTNNGWPSTRSGPAPTSEAARTKLIDDLQDKKTEHYKKIVESAAEARAGVLELMDEGLAREDVAMCICSAATKEGFVKVVNSVVGRQRLDRFDIILAGDDVKRKKPDPMIYNMARERLGLPADRCVVIEDSLVGLRAAKAAGMHCIITPTASTASADFRAEGAAAVVPSLKTDSFQVTIDKIFSQLKDSDGCRLMKETRKVVTPRARTPVAATRRW